MLLHRKKDSRDARSTSLTGTPGRRREPRVLLRCGRRTRRDQHARERLLDARLEIAGLAALAIERHQRVDLGGADRPAIRAARQRVRIDARTTSLRPADCRPAREDPARLGVSPTPVVLERAGDHEVRHAARVREHRIRAEVRIDLVHASAALPIRQRQADGVRPGRHLQAEAARVVDLDLFAVERDVERSAGTAAPAADRELVFGIEREGVVNQQAAACAERQAVDVTVLRQPWRRREGDLRGAPARRPPPGG